MKKTSFLLLLIVLLSSCGIVKEIFSAGMSFGIFLIIAILVVIVGIVMKVRKK